MDQTIKVEAKTEKKISTGVKSSFTSFYTKEVRRIKKDDDAYIKKLNQAIKDFNNMY